LVKQNKIPSRGDAIYINFTPQAGKEMDGPHPALVLSQFQYNSSTGLVIVVPITSSVGLHKIEIPIDKGHAVSGAILPDQIKCLDWKERGKKIICRLPDKYVLTVIGYLKAIIGF
jgi:mRNA interferase MazF